MSIPYLPGWWDQIGGSAMKFVDNLQRAAKPEFYAQKEYEELVRKNPLIMQDISNMDDAAKQQLAKAFRFKPGENPVEQSGVGLQRRQSEFNLDRLMRRAPIEDQMLQDNAIITGAQASVAPQIAQQNLTRLIQDNTLGGYNLKDAEDRRKQLDDAMAAIPDINQLNIPQIAAAAVSGQPVPPEMMTRIMTNPGAAQLYGAYEKTLRDNIAEGFMRGRISLRTPQEGVQLATILDRSLQDQTTALGQYRQMLAQFEKKSTVDLLMMTPEQKEEYQASLTDTQNKIGVIESNIDELQKGIGKLTGIDFKSIASPPPPPGPTQQAEAQIDPELALARQAIERGAPLEAVKKKYKERTGKDFPG